MIGFDFPTRVTGAGGIYVQKDREVPDTYMTMIEYPGEYAVNMISCMGNAQSVPMTVYGNWGTLQITAPPGSTGGGRRGRQVAVIKAERDFESEFKQANGGKTEVVIEPEESTDLADDWLNCMRTRESPVYNVLRGYQVMVAIRMGVDSYRSGRVMAFGPEGAAGAAGAAAARGISAEGGVGSRQLSTMPAEAGNELRDFPLVLAVWFAEPVHEFPLLEQQDQVSHRNQPKQEEVDPGVVDDAGAGE